MKAGQEPRHLSKELAAAHAEDKQAFILPKEQRVPLNSLVLVIRIKESRNATP